MPHELPRVHVDLIESLRCPRAHADGWLVASASSTRERRIIRGLVACPQCGAEWPIVEGMLDMTSTEQGVQPFAHPSGASGTPSGAALSPAPHPASTADSLRLTALLNLHDSRGAIVLTGHSASAADAIAERTGVIVLAVNPTGATAHNSVADSEHNPTSGSTAPKHSRLHINHALPLGVGTMRGVVLDPDHATPAWLRSAIRAVERNGRIIAPAHTTVPDDVTELARDEDQWVGEVRVESSGLVPLRRGGDPMA